ncbi:phosphopantetheine-binding protein [Staphylococcus saprophyticus]
MTDFVKDSIEYKVLQIWQEVLNTSNVNINSNFFELGGHSLLIFQLTSSINEEFNSDIPPSHLIQYPTPREMSNELRKKSKEKVHL